MDAKMPGRAQSAGMASSYQTRNKPLFYMRKLNRNMTV